MYIRKSRTGGIVGLGLVVFLLWTLLAAKPELRIERVCRPIQWSQNVAESIIGLTLPRLVTSVTESFGRVEYGCQYSVWRLFYEKKYIEEQRRMGLSEPTTAEN